MADEDMVMNDDGSVSIVVTKEVTTETFDPQLLKNEYEGVKSELENFDAVMANRRTYLIERLQKLEAMKQFMEQN